MTQAESIAKRYMDEEVEIYTDCVVGSQKYNDYEVTEKTCLSGIVRGAVGEMLILEVFVTTPQQKHSGEMLINGWSIHGVVKKNQNLNILTIFENGRRYQKKR